MSDELADQPPVTLKAPPPHKIYQPGSGGPNPNFYDDGIRTLQEVTIVDKSEKDR